MHAIARKLIAGALVLVGCVAQAATQYRITDLGALPGFTESSAHAINDRGQVAGYSFGGAPFYPSRASIWQAGALTGMPDTPGITSSAGYAINSRGDVVGGGLGGAFLWSGPAVTKLRELPGGQGLEAAFGINGTGEIVGHVISPQNQARYVNNGQVSPLPEPTAAGFSASWAWAISDSGHIVGASSALGTAAYWDSATTQPVSLPHAGLGAGGMARAVNEQGDAAGGIREAGVFNRHATLWAGGIPTLLPDGPGMGGSEAWGMNDARQVVGHSVPMFTNASTFLSEGRATLWENGIAYDLNSLILAGPTGPTGPTGSNWTLYIAWDINDLGQIVGEGRNPDGLTRGFLLTPVPEPEQYALLLAGLAVLAAVRRRRARTIVDGRAPPAGTV